MAYEDMKVRIQKKIPHGLSRGLTRTPDLRADLSSPEPKLRRSRRLRDLRAKRSVPSTIISSVDGEYGATEPAMQDLSPCPSTRTPCSSTRRISVSRLPSLSQPMKETNIDVHHNKEAFLYSPTSHPSDHKSNPASESLDKHHSYGSIPVDSSSDDEYSAVGELLHKTRSSSGGSPLPKFIIKNRIHYPSSQSPLWKEFNTLATDVLPRKFTKTFIKTHSAQECIVQFETFLYNLLVEKFGTVPAPEEKKIFTPRKHHGLSQLRIAKTQARKTWRVLVKAGLQHTPLGKQHNKHWKRLIRRHNTLRVALRKRQHKREKIRAEREFKSDPHT